MWRPERPAQTTVVSTTDRECKPGTLKARLNVEGNRGYRRWEKELDLNVLDCGALQIIQEESQMPELKKRYEVAPKE